MPKDDELIERLTEADEARKAFEAARARMNEAIPDPVKATPAERALYDERYRADHEAKRAYWNHALTILMGGSVAAAASRIAELKAERERARSAMLDRLREGPGDYNKGFDNGIRAAVAAFDVALSNPPSGEVPK